MPFCKSCGNSVEGKSIICWKCGEALIDRDRIFQDPTKSSVNVQATVDPNMETLTENDAQFWIKKGEVIWCRLDTPELNAGKALDCFDHAIAIEPLNYIAWVNKGLILKKIGKHDDALLCFDRAISLKPENHKGWYNKGVLLISMLRFDEAIQCFFKVLELDSMDQMDEKEREMLLKMIKMKKA